MLEVNKPVIALKAIRSTVANALLDPDITDRSKKALREINKIALMGLDDSDGERNAEGWKPFRAGNVNGLTATTRWTQGRR